MRNRAHRPLIYAMGVHMADDNNIDTTVRESAIYELCNRLQPGICQDVNIPYAMTDWGGCIIQVKKRNKIEEGWQRNFLSAILSTSQGMRLAIAVDTDIDMYSMDEIIWALTTRVNPHTDILNPIPGGIGQTFQPQERMTAGDKEWTASNTRLHMPAGRRRLTPLGRPMARRAGLAQKLAGSRAARPHAGGGGGKECAARHERTNDWPQGGAQRSA